MPKAKPERPTSPPVDDAAPKCPTECTITSETEATFPTDRARTLLGVGETVTLTVDRGPAKWSVKGDGTLSAEEGTTVDFQVPDRAARVEVVAVADGCRCSITFDVVEPSGVVMRRKQGTEKWHERGRPSTGMITEVWITPAGVSFRAATFREQDAFAVGTGCFKKFSEANRVGHDPDINWASVESVDEDGAKLDWNDQVMAWGDDRCDGSFTWSIPWEFRVRDGPAKVFAIVEQTATVTRAGRASAEKAGAQVSSDLNDRSVEDPIFE